MHFAQVESFLEFCIIAGFVVFYVIAMLVKNANEAQKKKGRTGRARYPRLNQNNPQQDRLDSLRRALGVDSPAAGRPSRQARREVAPPPRREEPRPELPVSRRREQRAVPENDAFASSRTAYEERAAALTPAEFFAKRMDELGLNEAQRMVVYSEILRPVRARREGLPFEKTLL